MKALTATSDWMGKETFSGLHFNNTKTQFSSIIELRLFVHMGGKKGKISVMTPAEGLHPIPVPNSTVRLE